MVQSPVTPMTLAEFLQLPETKPASEYIDGTIIQKSMPKGRHSRLQSKLSTTLNQVAEEDKIAYAFPALRCSFGGRSIVPDVAVFEWSRIPFALEGDVPDDFPLAPDWTIEILSFGQRPNKILGNILHCLEYGSKLGWFIDPDDASILLLRPQQQPTLCLDNQPLPMFPELNLCLTTQQVFSWLNMR